MQVIRTLDPKQNQGAAPEIQALKNQLQERDRMFHSLEVVTLVVCGKNSVFFSWRLMLQFYFGFNYMDFLFYRKNMRKQKVKEKWRRNLSLVPGTTW